MIDCSGKDVEVQSAPENQSTMSYKAVSGLIKEGGGESDVVRGGSGRWNSRHWTSSS